jgi:hypothetical protein
LLRIKAEIICEYFSEDKLASFLPEEQKNEQGLAAAAVHLLKTEKLRGMFFSVETSNVINQAEENATMLNAVNNLGKIVQEALLTVSTQPKLLPLYRSMVEAIVSTMPRGRSFEAVLEGVFNGIEKELQEDGAQNQFLLGANENAANNLGQNVPNVKQIIELQKNALKDKELNVKAKIEADKIALANKELQIQQEEKLQEKA